MSKTQIIGGSVFVIVFKNFRMRVPYQGFYELVLLQLQGL